MRSERTCHPCGQLCGARERVTPPVKYWRKTLSSPRARLYICGSLPPRARLPLVAMLASSLVLAACGGSGPAAQQGPSNSTSHVSIKHESVAPGGGPAQSPPCDRPDPPRNNVRALADNCGVSAIEIVRPNALPIAPRVGTVEIDLYIEKPVVCGTDTPTTFCVVGDNRPHAPEGGPDPQADPSRNRVEGILDFTTGTVTFR